MTEEQSKAFADRLPKCELHLHFEGAVPLELVREWCERPIPENPTWSAHSYRYETFADFMEVMALTWRGTCNSLERLDRASSLIYQKLSEQNVRYLEMSFGAGAYPYPASETLAAFQNGIPDGMTVKIVAGVSRDRDTETILDATKAFLVCDDLDGIDLHGNEMVGDVSTFKDVFDEGRDRGLILKAHAGELRGPESVVEVIDQLGVQRIQHGVRGIESSSLVQRYVNDGIVLDTCPWSNVKLGVYPDLESHPIKELHRSGVSVTVNTDDPTPFGQTITDEYLWLMTECSMSVREVGEIAMNGFRASTLSKNAQNQAIREIEFLVTQCES